MATTFNPFSQGVFIPKPIPPTGPPENTKEVLILGDGNFSFTYNLCLQENDLYVSQDNERCKFSNYVIATEYKNRKTCEDYSFKAECKTAPGSNIIHWVKDDSSTETVPGSNIIHSVKDDPCIETVYTIKALELLTKIGVLFQFKINVENLKASYPTTRFKMLIFNCPDVSYGDEEKEPGIKPYDPTVELVRGFFKSASDVQDAGARVYMTLIQPEKSDKERIYYQGHKYALVDSASTNGYSLIDVRPPIEYEHQKTSGFRKVQEAHQGMAEFVFEKLGKDCSDDPSISRGSFVHKKSLKEVSTKYYNRSVSAYRTGYDNDLREIDRRILQISKQTAEQKRQELEEEESSDSSSESVEYASW